MTAAILFKEDWDRYPTAAVHHTTKNRTWVEYCQKLQLMGVSNSLFPLAIINRDLMSLDPFQEKNLTDNDIGLIITECKINPYYHLREIARAPRRSGFESLPFEANRANMAFLWLFFNHVTPILTQPRQTGKSFTVYELCTWLFGIRCRGSAINLLTKNDKLRVEAMDTVKEIYDQLPSYLKVKSRTDRWNTDEMQIDALKNFFKTHVPSQSETAANNVGRGNVGELVGTDEGPFQPNFKISLEAITGIMGRAVEIAKKANAPWGLWHTTTAGRTDEPSGEYMWKYISAGARWSEKFLDAKNIEHLYELIVQHAPGGAARVYCPFNHRQLGLPDSWLIEQKGRTNQDGDVFARDYLCIWTSGTEGSPFSVEQIRRITSSRNPAPHQNIYSYNYMLRWHIPREDMIQFLKNNSCTLGLDTSQALGNDAIGLVLTDNRTGGVVAGQEFKLTNIYKFSEFLFEFLRDHSNVTLIPERKDVALAIVDLLVVRMNSQGIDPYKRIFNRIIDEPNENPELYAELMLPPKRRQARTDLLMKKYIGFNTAGSGQHARNRLMVDTLFKAVEDCAETIRDSVLIDQLMTLEKSNGRIDHREGKQNDMVIAWLLTHWMLRTGRNLAHYGINPMAALSNVRAVKLNNSEIWKKVEQQKIKDEFDQILAKYAQSSDPMIQAHYLTKLKFLETKMMAEKMPAVSLDAILAQIKAERLKKNNIYRPSHIKTERPVVQQRSEYELWA